MISTEKPGTPEELVHAGIKGMHWGIRKNREVSPKRQAKREAKAQKFVKKSANLQKQIDVIKAKPKTTSVQGKVTQGFRNRKIADLQKDKARADKDIEAKLQGKLSRKQKQVAIGAAVVGTLVVTGVVLAKMNSGSARETMIKGREAITGKTFQFKQKPEFADPNLSPSQLKNMAKDINPGYPGKIGSGQNCRRATFAYEMRRRGHDVVATRTPTGSGQTSIGLFNVLDRGNKDMSRTGLIRRAAKNPDDPLVRAVTGLHEANNSRFKIDAAHSKGIFEALARQPERSRGELGVKWIDGGGHSMAYEIIHGKPHIFDTQTGRVFDTAKDFADQLPLVGKAGFTRLDNIPLDENFLKRWVKNA